jgi:hypothetical protein
MYLRGMREWNEAGKGGGVNREMNKRCIAVVFTLL